MLKVIKTKEKFTKWLLIACCGCISLLGYGIYRTFFDMSRLPEGKYLTESTSPDGAYTLKAYLSDGGATTGYAVRGELVFNKGNKEKNIYWNYKESSADIHWQGKDTVEINGHSLHVPNDVYDFRRE